MAVGWLRALPRLQERSRPHTIVQHLPERVDLLLQARWDICHCYKNRSLRRRINYIYLAIGRTKRAAIAFRRVPQLGHLKPRPEQLAFSRPAARPTPIRDDLPPTIVELLDAMDHKASHPGAFRNRI